MRKQTKLAVGLSAAALLAIGATMTSFAARGWVAEGDQWYYYDSNGDYVTDKWKSYNGNYFYLGDEGYMLTNELIEDGNNYYYVDANGAMVKNAWIPVPADDSEDLDVEYRWYFFGSNGKAYKANYKKTINGKKYGFDEEGKMLFGFVDCNNYEILNDSDDAILSCDRYYGTNEDGAMYTGWLLYTDALDATGYDDQYYWFHFKSNGLKRTNTTAKINGKQYTFDQYGVMLHDWQLATIGKTSTGAKAEEYGFFSTEDDGALKKNVWVWSDVDGKVGGDGDNHWWWVNKNGVRFTDGVKKINGKYYAFDAEGVMQWGLVVLSDQSEKKTGANVKLSGTKVVDSWDPEDLTAEQIYGDEFANLFYFSSDEEKDGSMKTGANVKIELWDDTYTFGFDKNSGLAYDGVKNNKLYRHGILQTASDNKYEKAYNDMLISANGTVMKPSSRTYKDADDMYWSVAKDWTAMGPYNTAAEAKAVANK
jgi:glucan-binding YG repeat protein